MNKYSLYLLFNTNNNRTYIGVTNNLKRRIRQHNGLLKGGAKYTRNFKGLGEWKYYMYISGYTKQQCMSFEKNVKNTKCYLSKSTPIDRRIYNINSWYSKYPCGKIEFITI